MTTEPPSPEDDSNEQPTHADSWYIAESQDWWTSNYQGTRVAFDVADVPPWEALWLVPKGPLANHNLAGFRTRRHGGPHDCDYAMQRALREFLGAVTLASGHVELEMKRILLTAKAAPDLDFSDVDLTWKQLEDALAKVAADDTSPLSAKLKPVLEWGRARRIRDRRNEAIHSAWSLYDMGHFHASRVPFKSAGQTIVARPQRAAEFITVLWDYLGRLQCVVAWPIEVLPPLDPETPRIETVVEVSGAEMEH